MVTANQDRTADLHQCLATISWSLAQAEATDDEDAADALIALCRTSLDLVAAGITPPNSEGSKDLD